MKLPVSASRILDRKEASALRRIAILQAALEAARAEAAEIQDAKRCLAQPNGHAVQIRRLLGNARLTQKDFVLAAVRSRPKRGMTRRDIAEYVENKHEVYVSPNAVTTYLYHLRLDGLVEFDGDVWRPAVGA